MKSSITKTSQAEASTRPFQSHLGQCQGRFAPSVVDEETEIQRVSNIRATCYESM